MNDGIERRDFIRGAGLVTGAALAATLSDTSAALAQATPNPGPKPMTYDVKPLPFDPKSVKGLSEKLLVSHY